MQVKVPVIVVGCKLDLRDESQQVSLECVMTQLLQQFKEIVTCIECSAATQYQVFCFAALLFCYLVMLTDVWILYRVIRKQCINCGLRKMAESQ